MDGKTSMTDVKTAHTASMEFSEADSKRFWDKTTPGGDDCIIWTGYTREGYGLFNLRGKPVSSHRAAYFNAHPDADITKTVRHFTCSNKLCVNPEHLRLSKGKWQGKKHLQKLSLSDITDIEKSLSAESYRGQITDLARKYGVSHSYISHIKKRLAN